MQAVTLDTSETQPALREDLPEPTPADNEVLVRVQASSVNPVDNSIAAGMLAQMGVEYDYPVTLGRDYAGVVERVGTAVSGYRPGDHVFGFVLHAHPKAHDGAWAELITVTEDLSISPVPDGIDLAVAGAAPLAGITAMTLVDALELAEDHVLLVAGATGGVGSLAVQLAARAGARILAPALPEDEAFLRELGVTDVLPRDGDIARLVRDLVPDGVDALLDLVKRAGHLRRGAQARRAHRLTDRRRRRRPRPHLRHGRPEPGEPAASRRAARRRDAARSRPSDLRAGRGARGARRAGRRAHPGQARDRGPLIMLRG